MKFQDQQHKWGKWLRDPEGVVPPEKIEARRLAVYRRLVHQNIRQFLNNGFPVLAKTLAAKEWSQLQSDFIRQHHAVSPLFSNIGAEFVDYLASQTSILPDAPWLYELAVYERMEVDAQFALVPESLRFVAQEQSSSLNQSEHLQTNPSLHLGVFNWPVAQIGPDFKPTSPLTEPLAIAVYRDAKQQVRFIQLNPLTAVLLEQLRPKPLAFESLLARMVEQLGNTQQVDLAKPLAEVLQEFKHRGVLLAAPE